MPAPDVTLPVRAGLLPLLHTLTVAAIATATVGWPQAARAESLRCNEGTVAEGDSRLSVAFKCGQPLQKDAHCDPLYYSGPPLGYPVIPPCAPVEDWLYDRGAGNLMATVRFRAGVVQSISYGRVPR